MFFLYSDKTEGKRLLNRDKFWLFVSFCFSIVDMVNRFQSATPVCRRKSSIYQSRKIASLFLALVFFSRCKIFNFILVAFYLFFTEKKDESYKESTSISKL